MIFAPSPSSISHDFFTSLILGRFSIVQTPFIKSVAGYSYLDKQYDEISNESRKAIFDGIISIRKWCDEMEKTLNTIHINSDTIIIESED